MPLPLENQICFTLYATSMAAGRMYKPMLDTLGITYPQYLVMCTLGEEGMMTVGAVAQRLWLDSSTVTPLVKRMEAAGLVSKVRERADERRVLVELTDRGRSLLVKCSCLGETMIERSGMTLEKLTQLNRKIQQLHDALMQP